ncbi:hypothetical protein MMC13_000945 [Lambiella insularis]|nr:hypothetical protein [Lambiella insularis]
MFSALRTRILDFMSPRRDDTSSRSPVQQSPLHKVKDGRVSKPGTSKPQKPVDAQQLMSNALENLEKKNYITSTSHGATEAESSETEDINTNGSETPSERSTPMTSPSTASIIGKDTAWIAEDKKQKSLDYLDCDAAGDILSSDNDSDEGSDSETQQLSKAEQAENAFDLEVEGSEMRKAIAIEDNPGWTQSEIDLFNKLNMRGFEPLFPTPWHIDFPTLPPGLFSSNDQLVFIKSLCSKDFRAQRALSVLLSLGPKVRDRLRCKLSPVPTITREIRDYIKWSHVDAGLDKCDPIPALAFVSANEGESVASAVTRARDQMHDLGRQYREEFRIVPDKAPKKQPTNPKAEKNSTVKQVSDNDLDEDKILDDEDEVAEELAELLEEGEEEFEPLPTIYGIVVIHTVVSVVTYNSSIVGKDIRALALFDFGIEDQDVWNSFAVAILVVWVRNYLDGLHWAQVVPQVKEEDPDA